MACKQLYDVFVISKEDSAVLVGSKHFQGRMTLEAIRQFTKCQIPALQRIVRETEAKPYDGISLHGCKALGDGWITCIFIVHESSPHLRHNFWTDELFTNKSKLPVSA